MNKLFIVTVVVVVLGWANSAGGQRALNQDFFTAQQFPDTKHLLNLVDEYHTNKAMASLAKGTGVGYAIEDLKYTLDTFPNHPRALMLMGMAAKLASTPSLPLPYYEKAVRLFPQYAMTYAQYGNYQVEVGLVEQGIETLKRAIEIDRDFALAYEWLAKAYARAGDKEMEREMILKAKEIKGKAK